MPFAKTRLCGVQTATVLRVFQKERDACKGLNLSALSGRISLLQPNSYIGKVMEKYTIISKKTLAERVNEYVIYAPAVAKHCLAGQFIILRVDEDGERVPFTICDYSREQGTVSILVQEVGYTTMRLAMLNEGDRLCDFVGPLGNPTDLSAYKRILLVGGGIGTAVIFPQAKQLFAEGKPADVVVGARNVSLVMYEEQFKKNCAAFYLITDDGSSGKKGFVTDVARELFEKANVTTQCLLWVRSE